jgi:hypothetical protein
VAKEIAKESVMRELRECEKVCDMIDVGCGKNAS